MSVDKWNNRFKKDPRKADDYLSKRFQEHIFNEEDRTSKAQKKKDLEETGGITPAMLASWFERGSTFGGTPEAIVASEKAGQAQLVKSDYLPTKGLEKDKLEKIGFVIGEKRDDLFTHVQLPKGWTKVSSSHDMWSYLKDENGIERASIFYKAAFYDRSAHIGFNQRYIRYTGRGSYPETGNYESQVTWSAVQDRKTGEFLNVLPDIQPVENKHNPGTMQKDYEAQDRDDKAQKAWLAVNFPQYEDFTAYWND